MPDKVPTVVLVPGAWHSPSHYQSFADKLNSAGFPVVVASLPSVGPSHPEDKTLANDIAFVRSHFILPELDQDGNDVILLLHSYGGMVGGGAAKGLGKTSRGDGKTAVIGMIYTCALIGFEGKPMHSDMTQLAPWAALAEDKRYCVVPDPATCFYEKVADKEARDAAIKELRPVSCASFTSPSPAQAYPDSEFDGRRTYVRCLQDKAVVLAVQDMNLAGTGDIHWDVENLDDAGHSPFMTHEPRMIEIVQKYASIW